MTEFIIVGRGLAADVIAHTFYEEKISFKIIGKRQLSNCSNVAAGIFNPVVFKRMTKSWLAEDLIPYLLTFYSSCEKKLDVKLLNERPIIKPFVEEQEKILWLKKAAGELEGFLDTKIHDFDIAELKHCKLTAQYGLVKQSGNLNVSTFLNASDLYFKDNLVDEVFHHNEVKVNADHILYKGIKAKNIIFCEGHLLKNNPFFNWVPLKPAKGETFIINAPNLKLHNKILNKNGYLMPLEEGSFKLGATYEWNELSDHATAKGKHELEAKLVQMITCSYEISNHQAGVRPSTTDRRPVVGKHPRYNNLYIFNGLGTKGVMLAPFLAKKFVNFYLQKEAFLKDADVSRFYSLYAG